jgi:acyl-coenzyme A thioesterase PaaI-like protein
MRKIFLRNLKLINFWFPFLGSGIKIVTVNKERTKFDVSLRLTLRNKNLFGTQFGGSLYSMTDPFFVFILILNMGEDYIVWDKSANIEFIKPGKSKVFTSIEISEKEIKRIKEEIDEIGKSTYFFDTEIVDKEGVLVAKVKKEVYVRKKDWKTIQRDEFVGGNDIIN